MENWYATQLKTLTGATIIQADFLPCEDFDNQQVPVLLLRLPNGSLVTLLALQDPEGNGPGWLELQADEQPTQAERPQVAQPTKYGAATVRLPVLSRSGNVETQQLQGVLYLFPGFEDLSLVLVKPHGSKAKGTKCPWQVLEATTGYKIADTIQNGTEQQAIAIAFNTLKAYGKARFVEKINSLKSTTPIP